MTHLRTAIARCDRALDRAFLRQGSQVRAYGLIPLRLVLGTLARFSR